MISLTKPEIETYCEQVSSGTPELLQELASQTQEKMEFPQMLTGPVEGRFLKLLVQMTNARRVLEIGMFTGYATLSMAEAVPEGGSVTTCEINPKTIDFAKKYFSRSPHGKKIQVMEGPAVETLKRLEPGFDFVFIDADKVSYPAYYEESLRLLRFGGVIALDNMLWSGEVVSPKDDDARILDRLNRAIAKDTRVEGVLLTVRDGIQVVRKR